MARTLFEELQVYQLAEKLADTIWESVVRWPVLARNTVGAQIIRSADSIGANIAEGAGRGGLTDNRRYVRIARGSLQETQHWLRRAFRRKLLTAEEINALKPILDELCPKLSGYLRFLETKLSEERPSRSRRVTPLKDESP